MFLQKRIVKSVKGLFTITALSLALLLPITACSSGSDIDDIDIPEEEEEEDPATILEKIEASIDKSQLSSDIVIDFAGFVDSTKDEIYASWPQYGRALAPDTHGDVIKIAYAKKDGNNKYKYSESSFTISNLYVSADSYLVFDYKCSFYSNCWDENGDYDPYSKLNGLYDSDEYVSLYIDNNLQAKKYGAMGNSIWRTAGVKISAGNNHTVKWDLPLPAYYFKNVENAIYLDNIRIVSKNDYEKVDLSPKGQQDVYVGDTLKFTATADWTNSKPVYSVTGGSGTINSSTGEFTPTAPGTFTITATIDGKTASTKTVTAHDFSATETIKTAGKTFTGKVENVSYAEVSTALDTTEILIKSDNLHKFNNSITDVATIKVSAINDKEDTHLFFDADGYFTIEGEIKDTANKYTIAVLPSSAYMTPVPGSKYPHQVDASGYYYTHYPVSGTFKKRIWLRFGVGDYKIYLAKQKYDPKEKVIASYFQLLYNVTNTNNSTSSNDMYLLPSTIVSSDSYEVSNAVHDALYGKENVPDGQKLQAMYSWLMHKTHYDYVSLDGTKRKPQDSIYCLRNGLGVCEGFANTFAAMSRYCGIPAAVISSNKMNHAWNAIYYDKQWLLLDLTWDNGAYDPDQRTSNVDKHPYDEAYDYFLIGLNGAARYDKYNNIYYDHTDNETKFTNPRNVVLPPKSESQQFSYYDNSDPTYQPGLPRGWY